jgi:hypothetical protein
VSGTNLGALSQKWRSTSWFAATEHGGSPQARTHQSDQAAPSNLMVNCRQATKSERVWGYSHIPHPGGHKQTKRYSFE